jgi:hypothetical protein
MRNLIDGVLVVIGAVVLSVAGLLLVRAFVPVRLLGDTAGVGDDFITVLGTAYGVLIAFVVSSVWNRFTDSEREADLEINEIFSLLRVTNLIRSEDGRALHRGLLAYVHSLLEDEWGLLASGRRSDRSSDLLSGLWGTFTQIYSSAPAGDLVVAEALQRLEGLTDRRRIRLFNSDDAVPTVLWVLLIVEGVITIAFTYLLVAPSTAVQALMTAALAATIATSLYLIAALNHPFAGTPRVSEDNLRGELRLWEQKIEAVERQDSLLS